MSAKPASKTRYKVGDTLQVDKRKSLGHNRTPIYIRGKTGVVCKVQGLFHDPGRLAYHRPGLPMQVWYKLRFRQTDLWRNYKGDPADQLEVDVPEDWLIEPKGKSR